MTWNPRRVGQTSERTSLKHRLPRPPGNLFTEKGVTRALAATARNIANAIRFVVIRSRRVSRRNAVRTLVGLLVVGSLYILVQDIPGPRPRDVPTSSSGFYEDSVWVGVGDTDDFSSTFFYAGEEPTLALEPTSDGWSGAFTFEVSRASIASSRGTFQVILPRTAQVTDASSQPEIVTSIDRFDSRIRVLVDVTGTDDTESLRGYIQVEWKDERSVQHLGFGKSKHVLLISNAYRSGDGETIYAATPFKSRAYSNSAGEPTTNTPTANVLILLNDERLSFDSYFPEPDGEHGNSSNLIYRLSTDFPASDLEGTGMFRSIDVVVENSLRRFFVQVVAQVFFLALGFGLSEVAATLPRHKS